MMWAQGETKRACPSWVGQAHHSAWPVIAVLDRVSAYLGASSAKRPAAASVKCSPPPFACQKGKSAAVGFLVKTREVCRDSPLKHRWSTVAAFWAARLLGGGDAGHPAPRSHLLEHVPLCPCAPVTLLIMPSSSESCPPQPAQIASAPRCEGQRFRGTPSPLPPGSVPPSIQVIPRTRRSRQDLRGRTPFDR